MEDTPQQYVRDGFSVTTDRAQIELDAALTLLRTTIWGSELTLAVLERAAANSVCFGLHEKTADSETLIGFARAVSDLATYAYLTDVVIAESRRGQGLGRWLIACILAHPDLQNLRRVALLTSDAQMLYTPLGFMIGPGDKTYMEIAGHSEKEEKKGAASGTPTG